MNDKVNNKVGRKRITKKLTIEKEGIGYKYTLDSIHPDIFIIEILDNEKKPISEVTFEVVIDGGKAMTVRTDTNGIIRVSEPQNEIILSLV